MNSLWPDLNEEQLQETNDVLVILREQAKEIKRITNGVICATFSKMKYKSGPTAGIAALEKMVTKMSSPLYEEVLEEELAGKKDLNSLYKRTKYKFEIYNDEYRFRLFVLTYSEMFPVFLEVDEGILEEIQYKDQEEILSNERLKEIVREVFNSYKVRSVISKMLKQGKKD